MAKSFIDHGGRMTDFVSPQVGFLLHWAIDDVNESSDSMPGPVMILCADLLDHFYDDN